MHMDIDKKNQYGSINITLDAVAAVAGNAATECYGVVGMSSKRSIKEEINELLNACEIMYGDEHYAIISEVGICTGVDRLVNGNFNGEQRKYTDVIACQLYSSSACFHDMPSTRSKLELTINVGAVENLLV